MRKLLVPLGLLAAFASAGAQSGSSQYVKTGLEFPARGAPRRPFKLTVTFDIQEGYHIQAHNAKDPYIPTKVQVVAPKGFRVGAPGFPAAHRVTMMGETLNVFEGSIRVPVTITPPATAKGTQRISVKLRYQVCNDKSCLPPSDTTL